MQAKLAPAACCDKHSMAEAGPRASFAVRQKKFGISLSRIILYNGSSATQGDSVKGLESDVK